MVSGTPRLAYAEGKLMERLRMAAVDYVTAGWPILPTSPTGDRLVAGRGPVDAPTAYEWWSDKPYGIACRVGDRFDVLQVPVELGEHVLATLRRNHPVTPPVIEIPTQGSWLFAVTPYARRIPELPAHGPVRLCRRDTWILLPPTPVLDGEVLWVCRPP